MDISDVGNVISKPISISKTNAQKREMYPKPCVGCIFARGPVCTEVFAEIRYRIQCLPKWRAGSKIVPDGVNKYKNE